MPAVRLSLYTDAKYHIDGSEQDFRNIDRTFCLSIHNKDVEGVGVGI